MDDGRLKCSGCCIIRKAGVIVYVCQHTECTAQRYYYSLLENKNVKSDKILNTCFT
jgi:hypothetical protein